MTGRHLQVDVTALRAGDVVHAWGTRHVVDRTVPDPDRNECRVFARTGRTSPPTVLVYRYDHVLDVWRPDHRSTP